MTNKGKLRSYKFGELLRLMYNEFLGTTYIEDEIYARSTNFERTKMTLQLVLAGLYPPNELQKWKNNLNWQPIPINYVPEGQDILLNRVYICNSSKEEHNKVLQLPEVKKKLKSYENLTQNLTQLTGINITTTRDIFTLYCDLICLKFMDFELPSWVNEYLDNSQFLEAALTRLEILNYNKRLQRINSGPLVQKIMKDMSDAVNNKKKEKIFLYSSHDINIYGLLAALNLVEPHAPEFSSAVIIELLQLNNNYFVKILHYLGVPHEIRELQIPNCTSPCPLDNFLYSILDIFPSDDEINCL
ncbi:venom acid phosphatase Acph-1-like isoform X2 [Leptopilina boulardi]|nr:venom acid phosphatase Acph-1-like isoform X2 [Leptopilina boulardi]XP_051172510.1 venom acid phosphatase Acph-1-like isoform X2 [Leptopilina boulardi]